MYWYIGMNTLPVDVVEPDTLVKRLLPDGAFRMPFWLTWNGALTPL